MRSFFYIVAICILFASISSCSYRKLKDQGSFGPLSKDQMSYAIMDRALFQPYCVRCHGTKKQKGKVRLDSYPAVIKNLKLSLELTQDEEMPTKGDMPSDQIIELFEWWVEAGAPQFAKGKRGH